MPMVLLAINIANSFDISSDLDNSFRSCAEDSRISDFIIFLPGLGSNIFNVLERIGALSSSFDRSFKIHVVIEEKDREVIPFNYLSVLKDKYSNVFLSSKDNEILVGGLIFSHFSLTKYCPSEIDDFLNDLYNSEGNLGISRCFVVETKEDKDFIEDIYANAKCLRKGDRDIFVSRSLNNCDNFVNNEKNSYIKTSETKLIYSANDSTKDNGESLLVKTKKNKKGKR